MRQMGQALWTGTVGKGVDRAGAVGWWKKAARAGDARSMVTLGKLYESGNYVGKDLERARQYYQEALNAGYSKAKVHLERLSPVTEEEPPEPPAP